jgi:hypothetical protein
VRNDQAHPWALATASGLALIAGMSSGIASIALAMDAVHSITSGHCGEYEK